MVILSVIIYMTGLSFTPGKEWIIYLVYLPFLAGIVLNAMAYSKANDGFVTFGNVFGSCFKGTMIIILVMVAWGVLSTIVFPEMKTKTLEMIRIKMQQSNQAQKMTDDQMESAVSFMSNHWNTIVVGGSVLYNLFFGAIFSLIGGAVANKKGDNPFNNAQQM